MAIRLGRPRRGPRRLRLPARRPVASAPVRQMRRWRDYRAAQLAELHESNALRPPEPPAQPTTTTPAATDPPAPADPPVPADSPTGSPAGADEDRWALLRSPFKVGFFGALGVLAAWLLVDNITRLGTTLTILLTAVFLTLALNPVVEFLTRHHLARGLSVLTVFVALLGLLTLLGFLVVPPIVEQATRLVEDAPGYVEQLLNNPWVTQMDEEYGIAASIQAEATSRLTNGTFITTVFGGVLGAAGAVAGSVFGVFTVLVLTLYFLATLPAIKNAAATLVPASRRPRAVPLGEEVVRRVGGYALGQVTVATINGTCSWVVLTLLDLPYAAVLAVVVGVLGLIPLVGATIGAVIVAALALVDDPTKAIVIVVYYVLYQQLENYVIVPRIMRRTVSVPGAVTVVAVLAGGTLLGVLGALIAIPVAAGLLLLYEELLVPRQNST